MTARAPRLRRRHLLAAVPALLLAACDTTPPRTDFPPLTFGYLSKLHLKVANITIDDAAAPADTADTLHVEALAPASPTDALRRMAQERLIASANSGSAVFTIVTASLVRAPGGFEGVMAVRLDARKADGSLTGYAEAKVRRTYVTPDTSETGTREALYELVKLMMGDMNVEFEYQVKRRLRDFLQVDGGTAPAPAPVLQQDLGPDTSGAPGVAPGTPPGTPLGTPSAPPVGTPPAQ